MSCPVCSSSDASECEVFTTREFIDRFVREFRPALSSEAVALARVLAEDSPATYRILTCERCAVQYCDPMVAGTARFYDIVYRYMSEAGLRWEFHRWQRDVSPGGRILDIGCNDGTFVKYARSLGRDAEGVDFNPHQVQRAQEGGLPVSLVSADSLPGFLTDHGPYEVFTLWHVLEHLDDPLATLRVLGANAGPTTKLILAVPSDRFYFTRRCRRPITDYPPHHMTRWTRTALAEAGAATGWEMLAHDYESINLRSYGTCLTKSVVKRKNPLEELGMVLRHGRFTAHALLPELDHELNYWWIKILGRLAAWVMAQERHGLSGLSQYSVLGRRENR